MPTTHFLNLMDRSGSMAGRIDEAVNGYNVMNESSLKEGQDAVVTLAIFDNQFDVLYEKVPLIQMKKLTVDEVMPRGGTALYDSISKLLALGDRSQPTLVQVFSDGGENGSREMTQEQCQALCKQCEDAGWEIQFIGMDIDAKQAASGLQFRSAQTAYEAYSNLSNQEMGLKGAQGAQGPMGTAGTVGLKRAAYTTAVANHKITSLKDDEDSTTQQSRESS